MSFYQLSDVIDVNDMQTKKDLAHIIGKDFEVNNAEIGEQAVLNNLSDSHMFRRVERTSILDGVKESFRELRLIAQDAIYVLKKLN